MWEQNSYLLIQPSLVDHIRVNMRATKTLFFLNWQQYRISKYLPQPLKTENTSLKKKTNWLKSEVHCGTQKALVLQGKGPYLINSVDIFST